MKNFVKSSGNYCYDWCKLEEDGTLTFGDESGHEGGTTLSIKFFNGTTAKDYVKEVQDTLDHWEKNDSIFYQRIKSMMVDNNITIDTILRSAIEVRRNMNLMTVKELYEYAVYNDCENATIQIYQPECLDDSAKYIDVTEFTICGDTILLYPW